MSDVNTELLDLMPKAVDTSIGFGYSADTWDQASRIAKVLAASTLVPKHFQGRPEDVIVAMQCGAEIGLPPMAALQSIAVINGRPGLYADGFLGVIMASPAYRQHAEFYVLDSGEAVDHLRAVDLQKDETRAVVKFWRKGIADPFVGEFSIADAKRAKLWGKQGPWTDYPARMLRWRARGFAGRDGFAAELRGIKLTAELEDTPADGPVVDARPPAAVVRLSEKAVARQAPETPPSPVVEFEPAWEEPLPAPKPAGKSKPPMPAPAPIPKTPPAGTATETTDLLITETAYVQPKDQEPYYEVRAVVDAPGQAPIGMVFLTRDKPLYDLAASAEGTPQHFRMRWKSGKRADGSNCKVLEELAAS